MQRGTQRAPGLVGAALLLLLAVVRAVASATPERVYLFGHVFHWECLFKQLFAVPCPTCGLTRSVLLSLHGQFRDAAQVNPAGLLLVLGFVLFSLALIFLMFYRQRHTSLAAGAMHRRLRLGASLYGNLLLAVLFAHWLAQTLS